MLYSMDSSHYWDGSFLFYKIDGEVAFLWQQFLKATNKLETFYRTCRLKVDFLTGGANELHRFHFSGEEESASKEEILTKLMDRYGDMVKKLAFTYVKDINLAEDIAQDVFISCYRNLHLFEGNSSYKTWIYRIAANRSKDVLKSNAYKRILPFKKFTLPSREKTPELKVIDKSTQNIVTTSLMNLSPKYREILFFFYYEELKLKEISEITSLKEATVKTRLSRGKQLLKKELERRRFEYE